MVDYSGDRNLEPTPQRRQEARKQGRVARSGELVSAVLFLLGLLVLLAAGDGLIRFLGGYMERQLGGPAWVTADVGLVQSHFNETLRGLSRHVLPLFGLLVLGAVVANLAQVGFMFLPEKAAPDVSRLSPLRGLKRLFSLSSASRVGFGLLKIVIILTVAWVDLAGQRDALLGLGDASIQQIALFTSSVLLWCCLKIGAALLVLALFDYGLQRWKHERELKMTPRELRDEMRSQEGDPELRARRRRVQRQLAENRLAQTVPKADVVIADPNDPVVVIRYEAGSNGAPVVVAKGSGVLAGRIRQLAAQYGIPVIEKRRLARALHRDVDSGCPIPGNHYAAVARILARIYQQRGHEMLDAA